MTHKHVTPPFSLSPIKELKPCYNLEENISEVISLNLPNYLLCLGGKPVQLTFPFVAATLPS